MGSGYVPYQLLFQLHNAVKVARGYLLERRHPFLNRILGLTDFSKVWQSK